MLKSGAKAALSNPTIRAAAANAAHHALGHAVKHLGSKGEYGAMAAEHLAHHGAHHINKHLGAGRRRKHRKGGRAMAGNTRR